LALSIGIIVEVATYYINPNTSNMDAGIPILEWGLFITLFLFFFTFSYDWKEFYYALDVPNSQNSNLIVSTYPIPFLNSNL
jgi:hypothetical protein